MTGRRPIAEVRVVRMPHLHPDAVRIEVECSASCTGFTQIPSERFSLTVPVLITSACYDHEARCGECDVSLAHEQGDREARAELERTWNVVQAELSQRYVEGVRT
jgi:hypothetical protein